MVINFFICILFLGFGSCCLLVLWFFSRILMIGFGIGVRGVFVNESGVFYFGGGVLKSEEGVVCLWRGVRVDSF